MEFFFEEYNSIYFVQFFFFKDMVYSWMFIFFLNGLFINI